MPLSKFSNIKIWVELLFLFLKDKLTQWKTSFYKATFLFGVIYLFNSIWHSTSSSTKPQTLILYLIFCQSIILSISPIHRSIFEKIYSDDLNMWFADPTDVITSLRIEALGQFLIQYCVLFVAGTSFATALDHSILSFISIHSLVACVLAPLSAWMFISIHTILGLCSYWTGQPAPIALVIQKFTLIMGGVLAPLSIYPEVFQDILKTTPFGVALFGVGSSILDQKSSSSVTLILLVLYCLVFEKIIQLLKQKVRTTEGAI